VPSLPDIAMTAIRYREHNWRSKNGTEYMDEHQKDAAKNAMIFDAELHGNGTIEGLIDAYERQLIAAERDRWGDGVFYL
jgi:hypothetical protein